MRIPKRPPNTQQLLQEAFSDHTRMANIIQASIKAGESERYLHWDKLKYHRIPCGLSLEDWWLALKLARNRLIKELPLKDTQGLPFRFGLPDPAPELLHHITQHASGQISIQDQQIGSPATRDRYIVRSLIEEAITSSQLEGAATTRLIAKEMLRTQRKPRDTHEQMILNNYIAMKRIGELTDQPLSQKMLLELHRILTEDTLKDPSAAGRFRKSDESIHVFNEQDNEVLHTPPPAEELPRRLQALCRFANENTPEYFMSPVIRAVILHFWLAYDHPFVDGNGRCARALFYWSMLRQKYWLCEFISISEIINKAPTKYARAFLYTETDENDLTYFVLYHLEIIRKAVDQLNEYLTRKSNDVRKLETLLRSSRGLNHRQLALLSHALRHSDAQYTVKSHRNSHRVSDQTARTDLYDLADKRSLLVSRKPGRTFYFTPAPDLEKRLRNLK